MSRIRCQQEPECEVLTAVDGACAVFCSRPVECPICHVMRSILVNRDGRTRCWDCDGAYLKSGILPEQEACDGLLG